MVSPEPSSPPDEGLTEGEREAVAALTAFLAEAAYGTAIVLPPYLYAKLIKLGLRRDAIKAAVALTGRAPSFRTPHRGPRVTARVGGTVTAASRIAAEEPRMRALYLFNAARRITRDLRTIVPPKPGEKAPDAAQRLQDALRRERRYWRMHLDAQRRRRAAAQAVDDVADKHGPWLRWQVNRDLNNTPGCLWANGQIFTRDAPLVFSDDPGVPPKPQIPGAVHARCGCVAVPAFRFS